MSQDSPEPDHTPPAPDSDDATLIRSMYERIKRLENRVETLEEENSMLETNAERMQKQLRSFQQTVQPVESKLTKTDERIEKVESAIESVEMGLNTASSRADVLYEKISRNAAELTNLQFDAGEQRATLSRRISALEQETGIKQWESESTLSAAACDLERFAAMPDEKRDEELRTPTARAVVVWEHFDEWSSPTHKGRIIRSGELRKLLQVALDTQIAWTQVYRVMEEFDANTDSEYKDITNETFGRALIRLKDPDQA